MRNEKLIIKKFYYNLRGLVKQIGFLENENDLEIYKLILDYTKYKPDKYFDIFLSLPYKARRKILRSLNFRNDEEYGKHIKRNLGIYKVDCKLRDEKKEWLFIFVICNFIFSIFNFIL